MELIWETKLADPVAGYSQTSVPTVVDNMVLIGSSGGEYHSRHFVHTEAKLAVALHWHMG